MVKIKQSRGQRRVGKNTLSAQRKASGKGLGGIFNRYGLNKETAQAVVNGEYSPPGLKPNEVRNLQKSLIQHGYVKT